MVALNLRQSDGRLVIPTRKLPLPESGLSLRAFAHCKSEGKLLLSSPFRAFFVTNLKLGGINELGNAGETDSHYPPDNDLLNMFATIEAVSQGGDFISHPRFLA